MTQRIQVAEVADSESKKSAQERQDLIAERTKRRREARLKNKRVESWRDLDPVKMYLKGIGEVGLLNRAGEVSVAKEIEAGREQVYDIIVRSRAGIEMILELPERLKDGSARAREVFDEYTPSADDSDLPVAPKVFDRFPPVERAWKKVQREKAKLAALHDEDADPKALDKAQKKLDKAQAKLEEAIDGCLLSQRFFNEIANRFKEAMENVHRCQRRISERFRKAYVRRDELEELILSRKEGRDIDYAKLPFDERYLEQTMQVIESSRGIIRSIEEQFHLDHDELSEVVGHIKAGERRADRGKAEMIRANLR
ncbi:MAG: sigma-70 factor domain-containing protein, partial [Persicimonas sp.]